MTSHDSRGQDPATTQIPPESSHLPWMEDIAGGADGLPSHSSEPNRDVQPAEAAKLHVAGHSLRLPQGSGAASMLMAVSALAQTPTQNVSDALLGQVHLAAAEEHVRRRASVDAGGYEASKPFNFGAAAPPSAIADRFGAATNGRDGSASATLPADMVGLLQDAAQIGVAQLSTSQDHLHPPTSAAPTFEDKEAITSNLSVSPGDDAFMTAGRRTAQDSLPLSPRSEARLQVGKIAANVAAHEYVAQSFPGWTANTAVTAMEQSNRRYDASKPFQGVPSTPMMPTPSPAFLPPPDVIMGVRTPFSPTSTHLDASFVPSYHLAPDEYTLLASAAAVATAALTTASSSTTAFPTAALDVGMAGVRLDPSGRRRSSFATDVGQQLHDSRPLTVEEQQEVMATLRAWAGLEGATRQEQARLHLQSLTNPAAGMQYFPPDFARHFQSQLTALAAGYYHKLHADGLAQNQFAPPPLSASTDDAGPSTAARYVQTRAKDAGMASMDDQDPLNLISQASSSSGMAVDSPQIRDQLLRLAHQLYATGGKQGKGGDEGGKNADQGDTAAKGQASPAVGTAQQAHTELHPTLLPLLHTLHNLHPSHLPTLLLLSCAYYSTGDLAASLWYNKMILSIDPNYVESMSNIGTTLRALGRWHEAESWWWRAVRLRPGYWDAYENLLGVLCSPQQMPASDEESAAAEGVAERGELPSDLQDIIPVDRKPQTISPRFGEALKLCEFVEGSVLSKRQSADEERVRKIPVSASSGSLHHSLTAYMPTHLPVAQVPRLQNLFYAKGNLKYVLPDLGTVPAAREYEKAVEIVISPTEDNTYSIRDLILAVYVVSILTLGVTLPGHNPAQVASEIAQAVGIDLHHPHHIQVTTSGQYCILSPGGGVLRIVRTAGQRLVNTILRLGDGTHLPVLLILPSMCVKLSAILFAESHGQLPALVEAGRRANQGLEAIQSTLQQSQSMTSTILLTLAKLMQDASPRAVAGPHGMLGLDGLRPSTSLLLPLYYLSIAINQVASTANNLGILLSSIPVSATVTNAAGERQQITGQTVALQYYTFGLQLDPKHPHLYTNFGSLLKDLNHLPEAIQMYRKAIECNPDFDVALANLGNAIKDQGRTQESVQYYRRAVQVNPNFPEALCGLVNALLAICDWQQVYADDEEGKSGLMKRIVELLDRQLDEGQAYGIGALAAIQSPQGWAEFMVGMSGRTDEQYRQGWLERFQRLIDVGVGADRDGLSINEGSFVLRLIERSIRRTQRQWYVDTYGKVTGTATAVDAINVTAFDAQRYRRTPLPSCLGIPSVPSILPFHCFTLKISPRQIRLISHRTALRISQTTFSQPWIPSHVFPPPPPPAPRIRLAYISSDFNNHPLAHLMQSVFGMHDRTRFEVFLYATTPSDQSPYRKKIESEAEHFLDVSTWTNQAIIQRGLQDGIHIGINLSGFTKGARNEIFAARPFPLSIHYMGFAGGLAASWNDYSVVDPIACPPSVTSTEIWRAEKGGARSQPGLTDFDGDRDPECRDDDWVYPDRFIYMPNSYFVTDHRQGFRETEQKPGEEGQPSHPHHNSNEEAWREEEEKRWRTRKEMWPYLPDDFVILSDFNQLYKLEPTVFNLWLRILKRVPKSILWLLRFPAAGEVHLLRYARDHFGDQVAARVIFTDVAPKDVHIHRGRIADLFLDTLECGAHTTSADILWSGTPVLTWPRHEHKMASRVAASIVAATGHGAQMMVDSERAYEERALELVNSIQYTYVDEVGQQLAPISDDGSVYADALRFNSSSSSARSHQPKTMATAANGMPGEAGNPTATTLTEAAPAPTNVDTAAKETAETEEGDPLPARHSILLGQVGSRAPPNAVSRRARGELSELRKTLFLSRDASRLFDTPRWVRHLESGYEEAWRRWVEGIDTEESAEWDALPQRHPAKQSGHIWVQDRETERC